MKSSIFFFCITALIISAETASAEDTKPFVPSGIDVTAGDESYAIKQSGPGKISERQPESISNGFQGGAFFLLRFFQTAISPQDGPSCKFIPTCSAYGREAVVRHGAFLGAILAGERLLRCNPYTGHGPDPVPETFPFGR